MSTSKRFGLFGRKSAGPAPAIATAPGGLSPMSPTAPMPAVMAPTMPVATVAPVMAVAPSAPRVTAPTGGKMAMTQPLRRAAQLYGGTTATVFQGRRRTWRELEARVARLAGALQQLGMREGDRVAILALNSDRYLECYFAVPWGGGVVTPMNFRWALPEHVYSLNDCEATILVVDDAFQALVPQIRAEARTLTAGFIRAMAPIWTKTASSS